MWALVLAGVPNKQAGKLIDNLSEISDKEVLIDKYHQLALHYFHYSPEEALIYSQKALKLARKEGYLHGVQYALADIAFYYTLTGNQEESRRNLDESLFVKIQGKPQNSLVYAFIRFADYYRKEADFDSAAFYYEKAKVLTKGQGSSLESYLLNDNISSYHYQLSNYYKASISAFRALDIAQQLNDSLRMAQSWGLMALIHADMSTYDSAHHYLNLVSSVAQKFESEELKIFYNLNQGGLYFQQGEIMKALEEYNEALVNIEYNKMKHYYVQAL
ncbi:MAG: hypothetical protein RIB63_20280, partial [Fulvivirga sp.]